MAPIYELRCRRCDFAPPLGDEAVPPHSHGDPPFSGATEYILNKDGGYDGVPDGYLEFRRADGVVVELPHPIEESVLRENGGTFREACRSGNMLRVTYVVCRDCGSLAENRRIHDDRLGCLTAVAVSAVSYVAAVFAFWGQGAAPLLAFVATVAAFCAVAFLYGMVYRFRWSAANSSLKLRACPSCGSADFVPVDRLGKRKAARCPACGTRNLVSNGVGIS